MSPKYIDAFYTVKYIVRRIIRTSSAKVVVVCYVLKFAANQLYEALRRPTNTDRDTTKIFEMQPVAMKDEQQIKTVQDDQEAGYPLRKTKSSTVFPAHHCLIMTSLEQQPTKHPNKKARFEEVHHKPKSELEQLRSKRLQKERELECRRRDTEGESNQLQNSLRLSKSIPHILENFPVDDDMPPDLPCGKACAAQNFPIGEAELRQELCKREEELRSEIYVASNGDLEVPADFEIDMPIGDKLLLLMDVLEDTYREAYLEEKTRLKRKELCMDNCDSAVCLEYDLKDNL